MERIMLPSKDTPTPSEPSSDSAPQQRKPFYKRWWFVLIVILLALPVIKKIVDPAPPKPVASQSAQSATTTAPTAEPAPQSSAEPEPTPTVDTDSTPAPDPTTTTHDTDLTTGGIGYGEATVACDRAAQKRLFPGLDYNSDPIIGKQKGQVGLSDDQYLAIYNVKAGNRKTAITCLVDGTKDNVNVISVRETERR